VISGTAPVTSSRSPLPICNNPGLFVVVPTMLGLPLAVSVPPPSTEPSTSKVLGRLPGLSDCGSRRVTGERPTPGGTRFTDFAAQPPNFRFRCQRMPDEGIWARNQNEAGIKGPQSRCIDRNTG